MAGSQIFADDWGRFSSPLTWIATPPMVLVPGAAIRRYFQRGKKKIMVEVDIVHDSVVGLTVTIRYQLQDGCAVKCRFCSASTMGPARNLSATEIVETVVTSLSHELIRPADVKKLILATFGLGEPLHNVNAACEALRELHRRFPGAELIWSTAGPSGKENAFQQLLAVGKELSPHVQMQISVHHPIDQHRVRCLHQGIERPLELEPIKTLASWAEQWWTTTNNKVILNIGVGPGFAMWAYDDYEILRGIFHYELAIIKLSPETPHAVGVSNWKRADYLARLEEMGRNLQAKGYHVYKFIPPGLDLGSGCGAPSRPAEGVDFVPGSLRSLTVVSATSNGATISA